jgi:glutamine---fructose-6-phosphate transaminase (isomerizing)
MCGICAFIGKGSAFYYILCGLMMLQNRGYDSAGICSIEHDHLTKEHKLLCHKYASSKTLDALSLLEKYESDHISQIGIGHTRWATHGPKSDVNSHPHFDMYNRISVVHNGIIENYNDLKNELIENGFTFKSQTDTEVIANYVSHEYNKCGHVEEAIQRTTNKLEGTWGIVLLCSDRPNNVYCSRHGSPLLIGIADDYFIVSSEQSGFCGKVNNYICLKDSDVVVLRYEDEKLLHTTLSTYDKKELTETNIMKTPDPYPHWMLKEIYEQSDASLRAIGMGGRLDSDTTVKLGGLHNYKDRILALDNIIMLGCGTSFHSALYTMPVFKEIAGLNTVQCIDGAEFDAYDIPRDGKTGVIMISQSGETKDLHRCIEICNKNDLLMIGVVNVVDSMIAREVQCGVYLNAGREVAVASTKSFTSQSIVLLMIAIWFAQNKKTHECKRHRIIKGLRCLPYDIQSVVTKNLKPCKEIAKFLFTKDSCFSLGKHKNKAIAREGSLKIKEIGYIHAEGYSSSALKHGPFSLLGENTPAIIIKAKDEYENKINNVIEEVTARNTPIIEITDTVSHKYSKFVINIDKNEMCFGILANIPIQLIAYYIALCKGHNPDKPRNLAKVVTVE